MPLSMGRSVVLAARPSNSSRDMVSSKKYMQLKTHAANLQIQLNEQRRQFEQLGGLYNKHLWKDVDFALAGIIKTSFDAGRCEILINRGTQNGLKEGMFVIGDNCAIGTISAVTEQTARVTLFTDSDSQIAVTVADTKAMLRGIGGNLAKIDMVSAKRRLTVGDDVFVPRKPGCLDSPMLMGQISELSRSEKDPLLWDITVKPACDFDQICDVAVIIMHLN